MLPSTCNMWHHILRTPRTLVFAAHEAIAAICSNLFQPAQVLMLTHAVKAMQRRRHLEPIPADHAVDGGELGRLCRQRRHALTRCHHTHHSFDAGD